MKVLIIDNQFTQFKQLRSALKKYEYDVLPEEDGFVPFLSSVKVFIHRIDPERDSCGLDPDDIKREDEYREKAWEFLMQEVNKCDLILMDYRLGSPLTSMTGLDLTEEIWKGKGPGKGIPVLILSRDEQSREDIKLKWTSVRDNNPNRVDWEVKGYWGAKLLPEDFISAIVIPAIRKLYERWSSWEPSSGDKEKLLAILDEWINQSWVINWKCEKLKSLREKLKQQPELPDTDDWRYVFTYLTNHSKTTNPEDKLFQSINEIEC